MVRGAVIKRLDLRSQSFWSKTCGKRNLVSYRENKKSVQKRSRFNHIILLFSDAWHHTLRDIAGTSVLKIEVFKTALKFYENFLRRIDFFPFFFITLRIRTFFQSNHAASVSCVESKYRNA